MYIDPSIFLEYILQQEKERECENFLEKVRMGELVCYVSNFNIDSMLLILEKRTKNIQIMEKFLISILEYSGLNIYYMTLEDRIEALKHSKNYRLDFEDSMTLQAALVTENTKIVSFDKHFDNLTIKRVEPKDVIY